MKHAIITCCNAKYGDFLADHWFKSLKANVNLDNIDVVIIDYGITEEQKKRLDGAILIKKVQDGHVTSIRFRDMHKFLSENDYDQVMCVDGGDIIFQSDLKELFENDKDNIRAVCELHYSRIKKKMMQKFFTPEDFKRMADCLHKKKEINAGMFLGPSNKIKELCESVTGLLLDKNSFGPDQHAVNYLLYRDGFVELDSRYNFVITTTRKRFSIKNGEFFLNEKKIPIVHNAGNYKFFRPVENFGFGPEKNQLRTAFFSFINPLMRLFHKF